MIRQLIITADDYGLSRGITDTILETVDHGLVRRVSILANGNDTERALQEYEKRKGYLELAVHLNLTEGKALSVPADIPHLVYTDGRFRHSVGSLWCAYIFASQQMRNAFREEIRQEAGLQITRVCRAIGAERVIVNGHQHTHLLPFVSDELVRMENVSSLRTTCEPSFFFGPFSLIHGIARPVLRFLSRRATVATHMENEWLIGFLYEGRMTAERVQEGLSRTPPGGIVELLFHPGNASADEMRDWSAPPRNIAWYSSPDRVRESEFITSPRLKILLDASSAEV